jgi:hypothetical protein
MAYSGPTVTNPQYARNFPGSTTETLTWTLTSGSGRYVVVSVIAEDNEEVSGADTLPTGVTFNGTAMTASVTSTVNDAVNSSVSYWYMLETDLPVSGSYDIVATWSSAMDTTALSAMEIVGAAQSAPASTQNTSGNPSSYGKTSLSTTVSSANSLVLMTAADGDSSFTAPNHIYTDKETAQTQEFLLEGYSLSLLGTSQEHETSGTSTDSFTYSDFRHVSATICLEKASQSLSLTDASVASVATLAGDSVMTQSALALADSSIGPLSAAPAELISAPVTQTLTDAAIASAATIPTETISALALGLTDAPIVSAATTAAEAVTSVALYLVDSGIVSIALAAAEDIATEPVPVDVNIVHVWSEQRLLEIDNSPTLQPVARERRVLAAAPRTQQS